MTFIDGVYILSMAGSTMSLNNVARVEVLKGPQGTLYGRNATGGAVNVITKDPSSTFTLNGDVYGNQIEASLYASGPVTDLWLAICRILSRPAGRFRQQRHQ